MPTANIAPARALAENAKGGQPSSPKDKYRQAPRSALCFRADGVSFAAGDGKEGQLSARFKMRARSGEPIQHWYWGQVVHDMTGFSSPPTITVDYCHDENQVLGAADEFKTSNDGLDIGGMLLSLDPTDRAAEVITRSAAKPATPYQASIFFDFQSLEEVMAGASVEVNGRQIVGPALIVRKWSLRGVAVCPYGADKHTSTQFSGPLSGDIDLSLLFKESKMSATAPATQETAPASEAAKNLSEATPAAGAGAAAPANNPSPGASRTEFAAELKKFTDKFGAANGAKWFTEGKSYAEALELHAAELSTQLAASKTENGELAKRLTQAKPGEASPATFADGEGKPGSKAPESKLAQQIGPNLARFAAGIKLPGAK